MFRWLLIIFLSVSFKSIEVNAREYQDKSKHLFNLSLYEEVIDPELCEKQLSYINENTLLAAQFLDSGIRLPKGILTGNTFDMGNYFQCLGIKEEMSNTIIEGKYCMLNIPLNQNNELKNEASILNEGLITLGNKEILRAAEERVRLRKTVNALIGEVHNNDKSGSLEDLPTQMGLSVAVCIPKPCTARHALELSFPINVTALGFQFEEQFCRLPNDKQWAPADYVAITIFSILAFFTIISTAYDYSISLKKDSNTASTICKSFSVFTNYRRLMTFSSNSESLKCLDGIRALSLAWIIIGHTFSVVALQPRTLNILDALRWIDSFSSVWIVSAPISVDTFFMLSGFLVVYTTAGKLTSNKLLSNVHFYYLNRILRMFPILAAAILMEASIWNRMFDGPYLEEPVLSTIKCRTNWWTNLLYIQNFVKPLDMCLSHTWYLAIDMQLHILSPIILFWVLYNRRTAWISMTGFLIAIITATTIYCFINNFSGNIAAIGRTDDSITYMLYYYYNTLIRASPFLVGMCFGYLVHTYRGKKVKISKNKHVEDKNIVSQSPDKILSEKKNNTIIE